MKIETAINRIGCIGYFTLDRGEIFHEGELTQVSGRELDFEIQRSSDGGMRFRNGESVKVDLDKPIFWEDRLWTEEPAINMAKRGIRRSEEKRWRKR